jgi:acetylornithine deacetylase/succinyl-diaminopimelate desuccinylase-like protein
MSIIEDILIGIAATLLAVGMFIGCDLEERVCWIITPDEEISYIYADKPAAKE